MRTAQIVEEAARLLEAAGIGDARCEARELFLAASGMKLPDYAARLCEEMPEPVREACLAMAGRRGRGEPLQYITGLAPFYGREFEVRPGVLIPRFDTETLIEAALPHLSPGMRILDLCTGSGCILLTLLLEGPEGLTGVGCDLSETALLCAAGNAKRLGASAELVQSDLFSSIEGTFSLITANPPYIRSGDIGELDREVRDFEPRLALDGGADGLSIYRRILQDAALHLEEGGWLICEIGCDQAGDVKRLYEEAHFTGIRVVRDLAGRDRVILGVMRHV